MEEKWLSALKKDKNQLLEGKRSQKGQRKKKKQRIKYWCGWGTRKRLKCYKKWVKHDHESVNRPGAACRGNICIYRWIAAKLFKRILLKNEVEHWIRELKIVSSGMSGPTVLLMKFREETYLIKPLKYNLKIQSRHVIYLEDILPHDLCIGLHRCIQGFQNLLVERTIT